METLTLHLNEIQLDKLRRLAKQEGHPEDFFGYFVASLIEQTCDELLDGDDLDESDLEEWATANS